MASAWGIGAEDIPFDARLNEFPHWDSLGHVTLMLALEKNFKIEINYEILIELVTFQKIKDFINATF